MTSKKAVTRQKANIQAYKFTFESEHGQKVLYDLIKAHCLSMSYVPSDPYGTAFNEGARSVVNTILRKLAFDPSRWEHILRRIEDGTADEFGDND